MADRYQDRPFPTDAEHDRGAVRGECDPLAELAQLTGQSDPFGTRGQDAPSAPVAGQCPPAIRPRGGRSERARWVAAMDAARQAGSPATAGIRRAGAEVPEPRASYAPLRSPVSRSARTGPPRATREASSMA